MGEYRIGSANVGSTCFSISARRLTNGSAITSRPRRINRSNMKKCSDKPWLWFWSALNDGRPSPSSATTSPSRTVSSGIDASASTKPEYRRLNSLSLRERS
jgi:hypothetical protein